MHHEQIKWLVVMPVNRIFVVTVFWVNLLTYNDYDTMQIQFTSNVLAQKRNA